MRKYLLHILIISFVFLLAATASYAGELEDAKEKVRKYPGNAVAHYNLGGAYRKSGKYEEAIESYKKAIKIDPDFKDAHYNLGDAYGKFDLPPFFVPPLKLEFVFKQTVGA